MFRKKLKSQTTLKEEKEITYLAKERQEKYKKAINILREMGYIDIKSNDEISSKLASLKMKDLKNQKISLY